MSDENVQLVRRNYELINAIGRTDSGFVDPEDVAPDLWQRLAPDFELHERPELPDAKVYRGPDDAKDFWRKTQEIFAKIEWLPSEFTDLGDVVVVEAKVIAVGRGSDVPVEFEETDVFWFRDGLLTRLQGFATRVEAMAAVGVGS